MDVLQDNSVSIHHRHVQSLSIKVYKIRNALAPILLKELLMPNNEHRYNLRCLCQFKTPSINNVYHGKGSVSFLKPEIWEILPDSLTKMESKEAFKRAIKTWNTET